MRTKARCFFLPPLFELVIADLGCTPQAADLAYARASVEGMNFLYAAAPIVSTSLLASQRFVLIILLNKVRRMFDRLAKIDRPSSQSDCFAQVVGPTACGGTKPVVKLSADTCDVLERSGLVDPLPSLPADMRRVVSGSALLFLDPPGGLAEYQSIKDADRAEYIRFVVKQLESGKV